MKYTLFQKYLAHGLLGMIRTSLLEGKVQFLDGFVVVTEAKAKNISNFCNFISLNMSLTLYHVRLNTPICPSRDIFIA